MKKIVSLLFVLLLAYSTMFCIGCSASFEQSIKDGNNELYVLNIGGHEMKIDTSKSKYGTSGDLYVDSVKVDNNVSMNYISDGSFVYYKKNKSIYQYDIASAKSKFILEDEMVPTIDGCYENKYLYYGSMKYTDVTGTLTDLIVYDLTTGTEVTYIEDAGSITVGSGKLFVQPCTGAISKLTIRMFDVNGGNQTVIAEDSFNMKVIGDTLYYSALESEYPAMLFVKSYNINTGEIKVLTDVFGAFVTELQDTYAVFRNYENDEEYIVEYKGIIKVYLNGERLEFDQQPVMMNDRVMVPMRKIFEVLGYDVAWDDSTKTVIASKDSDVITTQIDNTDISYTGGTYTCDVAPTIISGRTLVPLRAISECAGCEVAWDGASYSVTITRK